jgi:hypothetical protein
MEDKMKDKEGTIETLERQLVQAGIKNKVMQADVEINKKKQDIISKSDKQYNQTNTEQINLRNNLKTEAMYKKKEMTDAVKNFEKELREVRKQQ